MTLNTGTRLGPYEIVSLVGEGGMGQVYKALDAGLNRTVAIKILPQHVSANADVKARFEREARALASFSRPHICSVFDVGPQAGTDYLVMEYFEGQTSPSGWRRGRCQLTKP
jgi:eukaryotic-like serine/threonine-protein kinase